MPNTSIEYKGDKGLAGQMSGLFSVAPSLVTQTLPPKESTFDEIDTSDRSESQYNYRRRDSLRRDELLFLGIFGSFVGKCLTVFARTDAIVMEFGIVSATLLWFFGLGLIVGTICFVIIRLARLGVAPK